VTFRFDHESPDAERTEAMLNDPSRLPVNHSSGQWNPTTRQIASEASLHRANASPRSDAEPIRRYRRVHPEVQVPWIGPY
jgi:hypothetical protein